MKPQFKLADAKSLDLKEQWDLMKKLLSVLQPIQTATVLQRQVHLRLSAFA